MAAKKQLTPAQQSTWDGLEGMGLDPEEYYDFDADVIKDFPPIPDELETKLKEIQHRTQRDLEKLERRLHD